MKSKSLPTFVIVIYILIGIFTFGRAYNEIARNPNYMHPDAETIGSVGCAILWPFYWSTVYWE